MSRSSLKFQDQNRYIVGLRSALGERGYRFLNRTVNCRAACSSLFRKKLEQTSSSKEVPLGVLRLGHAIAVYHDFVARVQLAFGPGKLRIIHEPDRDSIRLQFGMVPPANHERWRMRCIDID